MSSSMQACKPDDPLWLAWQHYVTTEEFANSRKWATHEEHTEGSLWGAFMAGWLAANQLAAQATKATP